MRKITWIIYLLVLSVSSALAHKVPKEAKVYFQSPQDGAMVSSPFRVKFMVDGFLIAPAGENIHKAGHYHLLIDLKKPLPLDQPIPRDENHIHFDQGETEAIIKLPPGTHTLQLVVGDEEHEPFEELISKPITIRVK